MNRDMVKVATFHDPSMAQMVALILQDAGIQYYIKNLHMSSTGYSFPGVEPELHVSSDQAKQSIQLLIENGDLSGFVHRQDETMKTNAWDHLFLPVLRWVAIGGGVYFIIRWLTRAYPF